MAASTTAGFPVPAASTAIHASHAVLKRRSIDPKSGRALEILGHAIEYLTDEFVHTGESFSANNAELKAVQLLMSLNREIYFQCPEVLPISKRLRAIFHLKAN